MDRIMMKHIKITKCTYERFSGSTELSSLVGSRLGGGGDLGKGNFSCYVISCCTHCMCRLFLVSLVLLVVPLHHAPSSSIS